MHDIIAKVDFGHNLQLANKVLVLINADCLVEPLESHHRVVTGGPASGVDGTVAAFANK